MPGAKGEFADEYLATSFYNLVKSTCYKTNFKEVNCPIIELSNYQFAELPDCRIAELSYYLCFMTDVHNKETRSYNMSRIRGKDTKP